MSEAPPPLDYQSPQAPPSPPTHHIVIGILGALIFVLCGVPASIALAYNNQGPWPPIVLGVICVSALVISIIQSRNARWRGYAAGVIIGLCVAALIEGLCFLAMR